MVLWLVAGLVVLLSIILLWLSIVTQFRLRAVVVISLSLSVLVTHLYCLELSSKLDNYYSTLHCFHCFKELSWDVSSSCSYCGSNIVAMDNIALRRKSLSCLTCGGVVTYDGMSCSHCGRQYEDVDFYTPVVNLECASSMFDLYVLLHIRYLLLVCLGMWGIILLDILNSIKYYVLRKEV